MECLCLLNIVKLSFDGDYLLDLWKNKERDVKVLKGTNIAFNLKKVYRLILSEVQLIVINISTVLQVHDRITNTNIQETYLHDFLKILKHTIQEFLIILEELSS